MAQGRVGSGGTSQWPGVSAVPEPAHSSAATHLLRATAGAPDPAPAPFSPMSDNIMNAPHGMNLVVECNDGSAVIGRFDESNGFEVVMHDVDLWESDQGSDEERESWVRSTATYGVAVKERDHRFSARLVERWRPLGDIEKLS